MRKRGSDPASQILNSVCYIIKRDSKIGAIFTIRVLGDFNRANVKKVLPKYYQHISFPTRDDQTLDHCYTQFKECYKHERIKLR